MAQHSLTPFRSGSLLGPDPFLSLHREMNRLFDDVLRGGSMPSAGGDGGFLAPQIDIAESDKEVRVTAELPGVSKDDIQIDLSDDILTIRGEKKAEKKEEKEKHHFVERSYGMFHRSLQLPYAVDPGQVRASFENGVLTITMPKSAQQQSAHRIEIQSGDGGRSAIGGGQSPQSGSKSESKTAH